VLGIFAQRLALTLSEYHEIGGTTMQRMNADQNDQADRDKQRVAANVRAELARQGMSVVDLAEALGVRYDILQRRTSGTVAFRVQELIEIGRMIGVYPSVFFNGITLTADQSASTPATPE
jgi:hypothetical protein